MPEGPNNHVLMNTPEGTQEQKLLYTFYYFLFLVVVGGEGTITGL